MLNFNASTLQRFNASTLQRFIIGILFVASFNQSASAQAINNQIQDVVMPSPNAASLGKYGDIPVSYSTGVPNIGIPIHTLTEGSLSLPISLSYHAGGVKVGEPSSWVGTGWSLQAGGMVSRMIQGRADESTGGYLQVGPAVNTYGFADPRYYVTPREIASGSQDGEPDIFSFSAGGYNGKFYIGLDGTAVTVPQQDISIQYSLSSGYGAGRLYKFTIKTPDGISYEFGDIGDGAPAMEYIQNPTTSITVNGWYLKRITSPDLTSTINLSYVEEDYRMFSRKSGGVVNGNVQVQKSTGGTGVTQYMDYQSLHLDKITTSTEIVTFAPGGNRADLLNTVPGKESKKLGSIKIENGSKCKNFVLTQSYFQDNDPNFKSNSEGDYRLKLESVQEQSCDGTVSVPPYTFAYYGQTGNINFLPDRYSSAVDHWGYYNAANDNPGGFNIPYTRLKYTDFRGVNFDVQTGISNRETNEETMKWGTIQKITYPTGGNTSFEFEANTYLDSNGLKVLRDTANLSLYWNEGTCGHDIKSQYPLFKTFSGTDLGNMFFKVESRRATFYEAGSCNTNTYSPQASINVYIGNSTTPICSASLPVPATILSGDATHLPIRYAIEMSKGKLIDLLPCLQPNTNYRFEIVGTNAAENFTFQQEILISPLTNKKVGGLRVKKIISSDGINTANDIVKTYDYSKIGTTQSSGQLQSIPKYGGIYDGIVYSPFSYQETYFRVHTFTDFSVVPLSSFEGITVGYSTVKEINSNNTATIYNYFQEPLQDYSGTTIPNNGSTSAIIVPPTQPNIDVGNLESKYSINSAGVTVSSQTNTRLDNNYTYSDGYFIKAGFLTIAQDGPSIYFIGYKIRNKPYRLKTTASIVDGVKTETSYTYDPYITRVRQELDLSVPIPSSSNFVNKTVGTSFVGFIPKRTETVTNSNGTPTTTTYSYPQDADLITTYAPLVARNMIFPVQTKTVTGIATKFTKVEYNSIAQPIYLKECLNNADQTNVNNWITRLYIESYSTNGMPTKVWKNNALTPEVYTWNNKLLLQKTYGTVTNNLLNWYLTYKAGTSLVEVITDENGLKKKYSYDPLMRLDSVQDRFNGSDVAPTNVQACIKYTYHYKGQPTTDSYDVNDANQNFVSTRTTFLNGTIPLSTKQYMDGLGRPREVVKQFYTPFAPTHTTANWHQKNYMTYDSLGRQFQSYLPFETGTLGYEDVITAAPTTPFVKMEYEQSPLSRPIKQTNVDGTVVQTSYSGNYASDGIRIFAQTTEGGVSSSGYYADNSLSKTMITDENNHQTVVFKDKLGRVVLTRKFLGGSQAVETYNVYDDFGNLVAVLPPGSVDGNGNVTYSLIFQYYYDTKNRLSQKKVPGADVQKFYYDNRDLLVLTQDGNMRIANKYLATLYDELGRVRKTGFATTITPTLGTDFTLTDALITDSLTSTLYYPNSSWVAHQGAKVLGDTAGLVRKYIWSYIERRPGYTYTGNPIWTGKQHLLSKTYLNGTTIMPDLPINDNDAGGVSWSVSGYDGLQKPTLTIGYLFSGSNNGSRAQEVRTWQTFNYDNAQRLTQANYTYGLFGAGISSPTDVLSNMAYNYKDQQIKKNTALVAGKYLQSTDYAYNTRGWLTDINAGFVPSALDYPLFNGLSTSANLIESYKTLGTTGYLTPSPNSGESNPDFFRETLRYQNPVLYGGGVSSVTGANNGNISQVEWQVAGREAQAYTLSYDDLDRLTDAKYTDIHSSGWGSRGWSNAYTSESRFDETPTYDVRGNIVSLNRTGWIGVTNLVATTGQALVGSKFGAIDNLSYVYGDSNRLKKVTDGAPLPQSALRGYHASNTGFDRDYAYDNNGNLIIDANKGIQKIDYNYLNLPQVITFTGGRIIKFLYDASGAKLRKTTIENGAVTSTRDYINGIEYNGGVLDRLAHTEGAVVRQSNGTYLHEYTIKDHLGNARVTYSDANNDGIVTVSDIKQINSYYPFGMNMEGNFNGAAGSNKYQYNSKELNDDFGLNWNDYGARFYDASLGRWWSVDPLSEKYFRESPYSYAGNNPILFIDYNGMDWGVSINTDKKTGNINVAFTFTGSVLNSSSKNVDMNKFAKSIKSQLEKSYSGSFKTKEGGSVNVTMSATINVINDKSKLDKNDHLLEIKDDKDIETKAGDAYAYASNVNGEPMIGGKGVMINADKVDDMMNGSDNNTIPHEVGHTGGLYHPDVSEGLEALKKSEGQYFRPYKGEDIYNLMYSNRHQKAYDGAINLNDRSSIEINQRQIHAIIRNVKTFNHTKINIK